MFKIFKRKKKKIKERKGIEPESAREKEIAAVIDVMPDGVIVLDLDGVILNYNQAATRMFGYKAEERIGKDFTELSESIRPEDIEGFLERFGRLMETGTAEHLEIVIRSKDGREAPIGVTYSLIKDDKGNPKNIIATLRDITELKRAEEERAKAKVEVETARATTELIQGMPEALVVLNLEGEIVFANPAHLKMMGHKSPGEIIGKSFAELRAPFINPEEDIPKMLELFRGVMVKGYSEQPIELNIRRVDDAREILVSASVAITKDAKGNPVNMVVTLRDITELKRAEEERTKAKAEVEVARATTEVMEGTPDALIAIGLDGEIVFANPAHLKMMGHKSPDEIVGKSFAELPEAFIKPEEDIPKFMELLKGVIEKGYTEQPVEVKLRRVDGTKEFVASASAAIIRDAEGNPINLVATLRDITELKRTQDEIVAARDYTDNIIKSMIDTLIVVDPDSNIQTINPATVELLGYKEDELTGIPVATIFAEEEEEEEEEEELRRSRAAG